MIAAETETRHIVIFYRRCTSPQFAIVIRAMQRAATWTARHPGLLSEVQIDLKKRREKYWVLQKGMAHWRSLLVSKPETRPKGSFVQDL